LATDLGIRHGMHKLGLSGDGAGVAQRWRPWRSYASMHVWKVASEQEELGCGQQ
jgi:AraC family transcriptional regulator, regulatory protein of adaptative response / DNA-3-methyladenine glycosylase II